METETFKNGFKSGDFWKHFISSVDRWEQYQNTSVDENVLLCFRREEEKNGRFWKCISVVGALVCYM